MLLLFCARLYAELLEYILVLLRLLEGRQIEIVLLVRLANNKLK